MKFLTFLIVICFVINIYPQIDYDIFLVPQGYGIKLLNSKGTSGIINEVSNISAMNPAAISQLENYSLGLSYQFQTNIDEAWYANVGTSRIYDFLPQSFGGIFKYNDFSFGIGMGQRYNGTMDLGLIEITTVTDPDGTGEFYEPEYERTLQNFSFAASYNFKNLFSEDSYLSAGLRYNLNRLYVYERINTIYTDEFTLGSNFEAGAVYKTEYERDKNIVLGIFYNSGTEFENVIDYKSDNEFISPEDSTIHFYKIQSFTRARIPDELHFDFGIEVTTNFLFTISIVDVFWNNSAENVRNQIEFSSSAVYSFNPSLTGSFGFYYTDRNYIDDVLDINSKMDALFLTAGLSFNISIFNVDLALADSHLYAGDFRKQTIGKIALGVCL